MKHAHHFQIKKSEPIFSRFVADSRFAEHSLTHGLLQIATVKNSNAILLGEWESLLAIQRFAPNLSPRPVARGNWGQVLHENFLLFEYHDLNLGPADFTSLPVAIAKLHRDSQGSCNEFGFVRPTYHGWIEQCNPKMKSWEAFFSDALNDSFRLYKRVVGETRFASIIDHEMEIRIEALLVRVVPRLLRSLDTGPHAIQPTLLHGDLWQGNFALDKATLRPIIFDPCSFWGHNECKL
jgi:protein-ribulosamine 3-kinase